MNIEFMLGGMLFEYEEEKNLTNIKKHGISFEIAARVFLDYDRIELYDDENSAFEDRYDTIGNAIYDGSEYAIGSLGRHEDILVVVYTERGWKNNEMVTGIISARRATSFERGVYYGKH